MKMDLRGRHYLQLKPNQGNCFRGFFPFQYTTAMDSREPTNRKQGKGGDVEEALGYIFGCFREDFGLLILPPPPQTVRVGIKESR